MREPVIFMSPEDSKSPPIPKTKKKPGPGPSPDKGDIMALDIRALALALGIVWAIFCLILALIKGDTIRLLYPAVSDSATINILIVIPLGFIYGVIFGSLLGLIYNKLIGDKR